MNGKAIFIILLSSLLLISGKSYSEQNHTWEKAFEEGNSLYENGLYEKALEKYRQCSSFGYESWELYYNMGNAYYRLIDYPHAILYYEKALRLAPKEQDIIDNLALSEQKIIDRFDPLPQFFLLKWWNGLCGIFSPAGWGTAILVTLGLSLFSISLYRHARSYRGKRAGFFLSAIFILLLCASFVFGTGQYRKLEETYAIVTETSVAAKSSPEDRSETKFVLHEGCKIKVEDQIGNYRKIRIKNGARGWIPESSIEKI